MERMTIRPITGHLRTEKSHFLTSFGSPCKVKKTLGTIVCDGIMMMNTSDHNERASSPITSLASVLIAANTVLRAVLPCLQQGPFSRGPMALKSENSVSKTRRRRRGTTSPPLTNIHPNPGPHRRAARRKRPSDSQSPHGVYLSEEKSDNIVERLKAKKSQGSIAKELKCSLKAVKRRAAKLKQKGEYARTPQGGKWRGSSRKRFAKEAKDSDKVNEEGDKANEGPSPKRKKLTDKERGAIEYGLTHKDSPGLISATWGDIRGQSRSAPKDCAKGAPSIGSQVVGVHRRPTREWNEESLEKRRKTHRSVFQTSAEMISTPTTSISLSRPSEQGIARSDSLEGDRPISPF